MKLGLSIGYSGARIRVPIEQIQLAEELGYDSVWTAEAYGSDAITVLAWVAAQTKRIRLGTGIMQLAGRPPAMAAMQIQTVDALAGGNRVIAGFGVSGPQIVEGWYGQPWGNPYWRLRDYIQIIRKINLREGPARHQGREISLPYTGEGASGLGKPLSSILHPNPDLPLWMGCGGEASVKLAAELVRRLAPAWIRSGADGSTLPPGSKRAFVEPETGSPGRISRSRAVARCKLPTTWPGPSAPPSRTSPCTSAGWATAP